MKLEEIRGLAEKFVKENNNLCVRMEIAGSIRREKAEPKDIEIVAIPKYNVGRNLFGQEISRKNVLWKWIESCHRADGAKAGFDIIKGSGDCPKYVQLQVHNGPKIDIFFATQENWGWIFFLRTGPKAWNIKAVQILAKKGYSFGDGYIKKREIFIDITTEKAIFKLLRWNWIKPRDRA